MSLLLRVPGLHRKAMVRRLMSDLLHASHIKSICTWMDRSFLQYSEASLAQGLLYVVYKIYALCNKTLTNGRVPIRTKSVLDVM